MSDWFTQGFQEAEKMASQGTRRRSRNFWTKPGESAVIRFLKPARESFNYKRAFVPWAKGQKLYTSPGSHPDPLTEAGLQLQASFAWLVLDRRVLKFSVEENGKTEDKEVGPRVVYFADGQRTRKGLIAFENEMLVQHNEELIEEGKDPVTLDEYNLTSYDIKVVKENKAPWQFFAVRGGKPKPLSKEDKEIIEKNSFDLVEELRPLPIQELRNILQREPVAAGGVSNGAASEYSYGDDQEEEEGSFFDT